VLVVHFLDQAGTSLTFGQAGEAMIM